MSAKSYNTNLASEFFVLSMLYRYGADAYLTLGNKKSVDILVQVGSDRITIDVKGMQGSTSWPIDNCVDDPYHYIVFVSYKGRIADCNALPEVYIVPAPDVEALSWLGPAKNRKMMNLSTLRKKGQQYLNNWNVFLPVEV